MKRKVVNICEQSESKCPAVITAILFHILMMAKNKASPLFTLKVQDQTKNSLWDDPCKGFPSTTGQSLVDLDFLGLYRIYIHPNWRSTRPNQRSCAQAGFAYMIHKGMKIPERVSMSLSSTAPVTKTPHLLDANEVNN